MNNKSEIKRFNEYAWKILLTKMSSKLKEEKV